MSDKTSLNLLKKISQGETVLLSGSFMPLEDGDKIYSNANHSEPYEVLTNPEFNIKVTGITQQ